MAELSAIDKKFWDAVSAGNLAQAKVAVDNGANIHVVRDDGQNVLFPAVTGRRFAMTAWLLGSGVDPNQIDASGHIALRKAVATHDPEMVELLLESGADPNLPVFIPFEERGTSSSPNVWPLHQACIDGDDRMVRAFIKHGADLERIGYAGGSPLWYAAANQHAGVCARLIAAGAPAEGWFKNRMKPSRTPWGPMASPKPEEKKELEDKPKVEWVIRKGNALCRVAEKGNVEVLQVLLDGGADLRDLIDEGGKERDLISEVEALPLSKTSRDGELTEYEPVKAMVDKYAVLPEPDMENLASLKKSDLFKPNEQGWCMMESPKFWQNFEAISQHLNEKGKSLTRKDLEKTNPEGISWLERGVECYATGALIEYLGERGEGLGRGNLLQPGGKPTPLLEKIIDRSQLSEIFNPRVWKGRTDEVLAIYRALPVELSSEVNNIHQLVAMGRQSGRKPDQPYFSPADGRVR